MHVSNAQVCLGSTQDSRDAYTYTEVTEVNCMDWSPHIQISARLLRFVIHCTSPYLTPVAQLFCSLQ